MSTSVEQEQYDLELEPNEELDALTQRSNDDGTVDVKLLEWEKNDSRDTVDIFFRRPDGSVQSETMDWPTHAEDESFKFVRLVAATPYTMATAGNICEDDDLWLKADPDDWSLVLPEPVSLRERLPSVGLWNAFVAVSYITTLAALTVVTVVMLL